MKDTVQILHLEDDSNDAELILETLLEAAIPCNVTLVRNRSDFLAALERRCWNLVLADYSLPDFDGLSALKDVVEKAPGTAFIFVTGAMGEDLAVETLKSGATDYVLKHRLERLGPCVRRALLETEEREKRRQAELNYRRLFETARDGVILLEAETGTIIDANPSVENILGYKGVEILGKKLWDTGPFREVSACQDAFRSLQGKEYVYYGDVSFQAQSGARINIELTGIAFRAGKTKMIRLTMRDITEHKKAQAENIRLATAIEQAVEGVMITDIAGSIQYVNPAFTSITGYSREEALGQNPRILKSGKHDLDFFKSLWSAILAGKTWRGEVINRRKDSSLYTEEMTITAVRDATGKTTNFIAIKEDITERKQLENVVQRNTELESANVAKDRFLAGMSHELRTPLNSIIGFTGTLLMKLPGPLTEGQTKQLQTIRSSAKHLLSLINDLLDLARIESGKIDLTIEAVVLQNIVEEVRGTLVPLAREKGLELKVTAPQAEVVLHTDRRALSQILLNLTGNAIKFTEEGEVRIVLNRESADGKPWTQLTVQDTGIGIRPDDQSKLFQAFTQVDRVRRYKEGSGLGLYLSHKLAEALGGQITFKSECGKGSTFTLFLPEIEPKS